MVGRIYQFSANIDADEIAKRALEELSSPNTDQAFVDFMQQMQAKMADDEQSKAASEPAIPNVQKNP